MEAQCPHREEEEGILKEGQPSESEYRDHGLRLAEIVANRTFPTSQQPCYDPAFGHLYTTTFSFTLTRLQIRIWYTKL